MLILTFLIGQNYSAQNVDTWVNDDLNLQELSSPGLKRDQSVHRAIRPYVRTSTDSLIKSDLKSDGFQWQLNPRSSISPIVGVESVFEQNGLTDQTELDLLGVLGVRSTYQIHTKLRLNADIYGAYALGSRIGEGLLDSAQVISGLGKGSLSAENLTAFGLNGGLTYSPSSLFDISLGRGKHFFGHGYRSLLLSDVASPFPYLKLQTKVWHINYVNLFSMQQGVLDIFDHPDDFENKFTSTHLLSWNISPKVDMQLFETIIWQGSDSLSDRGFDMNYLNPIIFFRPVEFSTGSSDNAIIGFGLSFKNSKDGQLYMQLALDEFFLKRLRARDGWWANKYGIQVGVKDFDFLDIPGLYVQAELNIVRPFTYSHGSAVQSYTHLNEPLAHPLGANFYEALFLTVFPIKERLEIRNQVMYQQYGRDADQGNLGGNIFRSYVNPRDQIGNFIGQGFNTEEISNRLYGSYLFNRASDFRLQLGYGFAYSFGDINEHLRHELTLGFRMNFRDNYR